MHAGSRKGNSGSWCPFLDALPGGPLAFVYRERLTPIPMLSVAFSQ